MPLILILMLILIIVFFTFFIILLIFCIKEGLFLEAENIINNFINGNRRRNHYINHPTRILPLNNIKEEELTIKKNYVVIQSPLNHISIGVEANIQSLKK